MHILFVEDHILFREALLHVLNQLESQVVVLAAANAEEAVQLIYNHERIFRPITICRQWNAKCS